LIRELALKYRQTVGVALSSPQSSASSVWE
jgi:hypothetical protein